MRFDAANLADLDGDRRLAGFGGQGLAGQDQRDFVAGLEVLRAADNLPLASPVIDAAKGELVGIGMFVARDDLSDNYPFKLAAELLRALDFQAEHGQFFRQLFGRAGEINVLPQPVKSDLHPRTTLKTWAACRR